MLLLEAVEDALAFQLAVSEVEWDVLVGLWLALRQSNIQDLEIQADNQHSEVGKLQVGMDPMGSVDQLSLDST